MLFRVDERLIHGQVVVGWARPLKIVRIIVVDDDVATSKIERDVYRTGLPVGIEARFWTIDDAIRDLAERPGGSERTMVLTASLPNMARLVLAGLSIAEVNVGGIHSGGNRRRVLPYVALDDEDDRAIDAIEKVGVQVIARDLPGSAPVRLVERSGG